MEAYGYVITDDDLISEDFVKALAWAEDDETDPELIVWGARLLAAARAYRSRQPAKQRVLMESKLKQNCTFRGEQPGPQKATAGHGEGTWERPARA